MEVTASAVADGDAVAIKGPPPPPSPLTGCYLLIVIAEPHSDDHKDIILQRIAKGLLSWDMENCHVDLEKELEAITSVGPEGEEARHGERLIQFATENLVTEVLIHPAANTLIQCMKNLLSSFTRHRHIIHSGYTFSGSGSWSLQDGTFSLADFSEAFQENEVQRVIRAYENTITIDIHCSPEGDWPRLPKEPFTKNCKVQVNPNDVLTSGSSSINNFLNYLSPFLLPSDIETLLESSDVVGNIRFSHPTLYVFPGGQGDAALFGINGFNMLVDGGFARKACFWDFTRHLDRLDAVLLTRLNNSNVCGVSSVLRRKTNNQVYPQIGHFFCNLQERKAISPDGDKDKDPLLINLLDEGHNIILNLRQLNLRPQPCYRDSEPINLYHKVGHGTLDMYVLSPAKDSREVKDFLQKWNSNDQKLFSTRKDSKEFSFPLPNLVSICALLVWQPANPSDTITRLLFPGSTPQHKIFEGLDKLKHLEFMKHPVCSAKTLTPSGSILGLSKSKPIKASTMLDKILPTEQKTQKILDNKPMKERSPPQNENKQKENKKLNDMNGTTNEENKIEKVIKSNSLDSEKSEPRSETKKTEINGKDVEIILENKSEMKSKSKPLETKQKIENKQKTPPKPRSESATRKSIEKKKIEKKIESKPSPPTPKKTIDTKVNGVAKDTKSKLLNKPALKSSPSTTPAKSTKDANNRKVVESKYKPAPKKEQPPKPPAEKKEPVKVERKPISRRPKAASPARSGKVPASPSKKPGIKTDKNGVGRTIKLDKEGTTDSSAVSTPSADQDSKKIDVTKLTKTELEELKAKELADLKEEQEVVKEIEAVFRKDEKLNESDQSQSDLRKIKDVSIDDKTTEGDEEEEEYLIVEKEEIEQNTDSVNEQESAAKEDEIQKHQRDSEESEKPRKGSDADKETESIPIVEEPVIQITQEPVETKLIEADTCKVLEIVPPATKEEEEVAAPPPAEMVRSKEDSRDKTEEMSKEISVTSPEDKIDASSSKKLTDTREIEEVEGEENKEVIDQNFVLESQPDEKFSTTIESGATTAPTLPEDERIPLDEIKEDQVIEEKYVKEETKEEKEIPTVVIPQKPFEPIAKISPIIGMKFDAHQSHIRDIVKTPDEVADLPVHEEVDIDTYDFPGTFKKDKTADAKKDADEAKAVKEIASTVKESTPKDAELAKDLKEELKEADKKDQEEKVEITEDIVKVQADKVEAVVEQIEADKDEIKDKFDNIKQGIESKLFIAENDIKQKIDDVKETVQGKVDNIEERIASAEGELQKIEKDFIDHKGVDVHGKIIDVKGRATELSEELKTMKEEVEKSVADQMGNLSKLCSNIAEGVKSISSHIIEEANIAKDILQDEAKEIKEHMVEAEDKAEENAKDKIEEVKEDIVAVEDKISSITEVTAEIKEAITEKLEKVQESATILEEKIEEKVGEEKEKVKEVAEEIKENVIVAEEKIVEEFNIVKDILKEEAKDVKDEMSKIEEAVIEKVDVIKDKVEEVKESLESKIVEEISDVKVKATEIKDELTEKASAVKDELVAVEEKVIDEVKEKTSEIATKIEETLEPIKETIVAAEDKVIDEVDTIKDSVINVVSDSKEKTKDIVSSLEDKIVDDVCQIKQKVGEMYEQEIDTLKEQTSKSVEEVKHKEEVLMEKASEMESKIEGFVKDEIQDIKDVSKEKISEIKKVEEELFEKVCTIKDTLQHKVEDTVSEISKITSEKIDEIEEEFETKTTTVISDAKEIISDIIKEAEDKTKEESKEQEKHETIDNLTSILNESKETLPKSVIHDDEHIDKFDSEIDNVQAKMESTYFSKHELPPVDERKEFEIGTKTPILEEDYAAREADIVKIVTSVAHVLKSDAPLEELAPTLPPEFGSPFKHYGVTGITTELRETHITTLDSPIQETVQLPSEAKEPIICPIQSTLSFIEEEKKIALEDTTTDLVQESPKEKKISDLIKDSNDLIASTSKIISGIKSGSSPDKEEEKEIAETDDDKDAGVKSDVGTVHRMLVTASSEDGGEETVICPAGSITYNKNEQEIENGLSPKSTPHEVLSGRSTPEIIETGADEIEAELQRAAASGKTSPDIVYEETKDASRKSSSAIDKDVILSGKSTPAADKDVVVSGKSTPAPENDVVLSGKSTPAPEKDVVVSGKSTPAPENDVVLSGKSTPAPEKDVVLSGKSTPAPEKDEIISGKSTPDLKEKHEGKSTPDIKQDTSGKSSPTKVEVTKIESLEASPRHSFDAAPSASIDKKSDKADLSGKSTPVDTALKQDVLSSGKSTPDIKDDKPDLDKYDNKSLEMKLAETETFVSKTEKFENEKQDVSDKQSPDIKTSPDIKDEISDTSTNMDVETVKEISPVTEKLISDAKDAKISSGTASPDLLKDSIDADKEAKSGKSTPDISKEAKNISSSQPGKVSPELKEEIQEEKDDFPEKLTIKEEEKSGKSTPDIKQQVVSGKSTPDIKNDTADFSGISTPDLKCEMDDVKSGKATPNLQTELNNLKASESGKSTPDISGKKSPLLQDDYIDIKKGFIETVEDVKPDEKDTIPFEEKFTEELHDSRKSSFGTKEIADIMPVDSVTNIKDMVNGKISPEIPCGPKKSITSSTESLETKTEILHTLSKEKEEEKLISSGKTTPQLDSKTISELKSEVSSGKSTPDLKTEVQKVEQIIALSESLVTKEISSFSVKTDATQSDTIKSDSVSNNNVSRQSVPDLKETFVTDSGKSTPDLKCERSKSIFSVGTEQSGKSTPELKFDDTSARSTPIHGLKEDLLMSGKSTPDIPEQTGKQTPSNGIATSDIKEEIVDTKPISGSVTPDIKDKTSEKGSPEIKDLSGKSTPAPKDDLKTSSGISSPVPEDKSGKHTPDIKGSSGKSTPAPVEKSGEQTPDHKESSGKSTPAPVIDSGKQTPDMKEASGKSTPAPVIESGKQTPDLKESSGKSTPAPVVESGKQTPDLKESSGKSTPAPVVESGKQTPDLKESSGKSTPAPVVESGKQTPDLKESSGKSTPAPIIESGKQTPDLKENSGKTTPALLIESDKQTSDIKESSGKSTPAPKDESGKHTPDIKEASGKSTPVPKEESGKQTPDLKESSGKSTPAPKEESGKQTPDLKGSSGKSTPAPKEESGKQTPDLKESSGKSTPAPKEESGKQTPDLKESSGKSTPAPKEESGKQTPDIRESSGKGSSGISSPDKMANLKDDSSKTSTDIKESLQKLDTTIELSKDILDIKEVSGKSTPEIQISSGKITPDIKLNTTTVETCDVKELDIKISTTEAIITKSDEPKKDQSSEKDPQPTVITTEIAELSIAGPSHRDESSKPNSGQITPSSKEITNLSSEDLHLSGKSTPDIADVERMKEIHEILKHEKHIPGSSTPPTVPVSPIVKESFSLQSEDSKTADKKEMCPIKSKESSSVDDKAKVEIDISQGKSTVVEKQESSTVKEVTEKSETKEVTSTKVVSATEVTSSVVSSTVKTSDVRCATPGSDVDDYEVGGVSSPHSDISSGQMSRVAHAWGHGSSEERQAYSDDDDVPGSPRSVTSQMAHSPPEHFIEPDFEAADILSKVGKHDPMSTSFYGALPDDPMDSPSKGSDNKTQPIPITSASKQYEYSSIHGTTEKRFLDDADLDFEKAMIEHRQTRGTDLVLATGVDSLNYKYEITTAKYSKEAKEATTEEKGGKNEFALKEINKNGFDSELDSSVQASSKKESPKKSSPEMMTSSFIEGSSGSQAASQDLKNDPIAHWGKPLGLPSPALPPSSDMSNKTTPKKMPPSATLAAKNKINDERKRSDSPSKYKNKKLTPIYLDLTYVPHHGNSYYSFVEFFKRIRARYYVFSGTEPSRDVYNALLEAKQTWEDKELEVTIIPTYDTDVLGYWVAENEDLLAKYKIDLSPSASRCTINLQDHETSCSAYRLEF